MGEFSKENRELILNMYGGKCAYCGMKMRQQEATIDHKIPKRKGGSNFNDNLFPCCIH